ncbi:MAG: hypothetical protein WAL34_04180 [Acidobacteriaceae bacterium]
MVSESEGSGQERVVTIEGHVQIDKLNEFLEEHLVLKDRKNIPPPRDRGKLCGWCDDEKYGQKLTVCTMTLHRDGTVEVGCRYE